MTPFYLTIDDGPSEDTETKWQLFEDHKISAIWFCLGKNLEKYPEVAMELIKKGHIIGNHSYNHPFFSQINFDECRDQIIKTEKIIDDIYSKAGVKRLAKFFRFPYGDQGHLEDWKISNNPEKTKHREKLQQLLKELGFQPGPFSKVEYRGLYINQPEDVDWLWSYDIREWDIGDKNDSHLSFEEVESNLRKYLPNYDRNKEQIILMHDHEQTAQYFPQLITILMEAQINLTIPKFN